MNQALGIEFKLLPGPADVRRGGPVVESRMAET